MNTKQIHEFLNSDVAYQTARATQNYFDMMLVLRAYKMNSSFNNACEQCEYKLEVQIS